MAKKKSADERKLEDRFIENVSRYPLYVLGVMLGGLWELIAPIRDLYRKSTFAGIAVTVAFGLGFLFVTLTLRAMMGQSVLPASFMS